MKPPVNVTDGMNGSRSQIANAWKSRVRMTSATTERLATMARIDRPDEQVERGDEEHGEEAAAERLDAQQPGKSQAVILNAITPAMSATIARFSSAMRPARQRHISSICVR